MKDVIKKIVDDGGWVYFPVCFAEIIVCNAFLRDVDEHEGTFNVVVYHDDYRNFHYSEYGKWIFSKEEDAKKAIERIPKKGQSVYHIIDNQIVEKQVEGYDGHSYYRINIQIILTGGERVHINELDNTLFTTLEAAKKHLG